MIQSPGSDGFAGFEEYRRRELPRIIKQRVEEAVQREHEPLEERVKNEVMQMIRDCTTELLQDYRRERQSVVSTPTPAVAGEHFFVSPPPIPAHRSGPDLLEASQNATKAHLTRSAQLSDSGYRSIGSSFTAANEATSYSATSGYPNFNTQSDQSFASASLYRAGSEIIEEQHPMADTMASIEASQIMRQTLPRSNRVPELHYQGNPGSRLNISTNESPLTTSSGIASAIEETGPGFTSFTDFTTFNSLADSEDLFDSNSIPEWNSETADSLMFLGDIQNLDFGHMDTTDNSDLPPAE